MVGRWYSVSLVFRIVHHVGSSVATNFIESIGHYSASTSCLFLLSHFCSKGEGCSKPSPRVPTSRRAIGIEFCQDRIAVEAFIVAAKINKKIAVHASLSRHQLLPLYCIVPALALALVLVPALALALVLVLEWY